MPKILVQTACFLTAFIFFSCVTTVENITEESVTSKNTEKTTANGDNPKENKGFVYSSRGMTDGPLLLGSTEHMNGPVVEFSILYSLYFPLSGILIPDHNYELSQGTRWQIQSDKFEESVYFERALLSEDDNGNSWWYLFVEGDGYKREFEFLLDQNWNLLEMRYFDKDTVKNYIPSVDEVRNLSNGAIEYNNFKAGRENIRTELGSYTTDHIIVNSQEYWMSNSVTGSFVQSVMKEDNTIIVKATLLEEKKNYKTVMDSY